MTYTVKQAYPHACMTFPTSGYMGRLESSVAGSRATRMKCCVRACVFIRWRDPTLRVVGKRDESYRPKSRLIGIAAGRLLVGKPSDPGQQTDANRLMPRSTTYDSSRPQPCGIFDRFNDFN